MDLQQILTLFLNSNPKWRTKLEAMTGQPSEYSIKCVNNFLEELNRGPGLKKPADKLQEFNANYQLVMGLGGFKEYEAQILAADMSGFTLAEVAQHFRMNLGWDTNVEEIKQIHEEALPKFKELGKKAGLFKDEPSEQSSVPNLGGSPNRKRKSGDNQLDLPPWRQQQRFNNQSQQHSSIIPHNEDNSIQ